MFASALPISLYEPTYKPQRTRELVFAPSPSQSVLPLRAERRSADDRTHVEQTLYAHHTSDRHTAHGRRPATHPAQRSRFPRAVFSPAHSNFVQNETRSIVVVAAPHVAAQFVMQRLDAPVWD